MSNPIFTSEHIDLTPQQALSSSAAHDREFKAEIHRIMKEGPSNIYEETFYTAANLKTRHPSVAAIRFSMNDMQRAFSCFPVTWRKEEHDKVFLGIQELLPRLPVKEGDDIGTVALQEMIIKAGWDGGAEWVQLDAKLVEFGVLLGIAFVVIRQKRRDLNSAFAGLVTCMEKTGLEGMEDANVD
ncbi:hypothetical protein T440DRAFT_477617 [Plenodomus tracheiphilus IPT5]|uniref:Uncharacterized protein n=1 Tax=Plenodomus tracheiphilus IPT5 TaxID=1408161 RepID=A0A6A7BET4_9PLEO|nr:hypothetical protein T440DRAFT_477617 [Plenodomus tracheiphilus IPT5]